jgi:hypothetical protein
MRRPHPTVVRQQRAVGGVELPDAVARGRYSSQRPSLALTPVRALSLFAMAVLNGDANVGCRK